MPLTASQCRGARAMLDWTQDDLSEKTGLTVNTISSFENGEHTPHEANRAKIRAALEAGGDLTPGRRAGDLQDGFVWQADIAPIEAESEAPVALFRVVLRVAQTAGGADGDGAAVTLTTLLLGAPP